MVLAAQKELDDAENDFKAKTLALATRDAKILTAAPKPNVVALDSPPKIPKGTFLAL